MSLATPDLDRYACDARFPGAEIVRLIRRTIAATRLDLKGLRVLTEASVGYRRLTPVLAALAGADEVFAVGRDTAAASRREGEEQTAYFAELAHVGARVSLLSTRLQAPLGEVDVVTDLPGVRPVDESILRTLQDTAAVSLMRGAAHWRSADVDVQTCRRQGIAVAAVDEEAYGLHRYVPFAVLASLLDLGVEIDGSTVVVAGDGAECAHIVQALARLRARVLVAAPVPAGRLELLGGEKAGESVDDGRVLGRLAEADALVLCPSPATTRLFSPGNRGTDTLAAAAPHLAVVGLEASTDLRALAAAGLRCRPAGGPDGLFDLLPQAVIAQHCAGLKVAEVMARARRRGSSPLAAEKLAAEEAGAELLPTDLGAGRR